MTDHIVPPIGMRMVKSAAAVLMALVMVVLIILLFKAEDAFGKDVEG